MDNVMHSLLGFQKSNHKYVKRFGVSGDYKYIYEYGTQAAKEAGGIAKQIKKKNYFGAIKSAVSLARGYDKARGGLKKQSSQDLLDSGAKAAISGKFQGNSFQNKTIRSLANAYVNSAEKREEIAKSIQSAKQALTNVPVSKLMSSANKTIKKGLGLLLGFFKHDDFDDGYVYYGGMIMHDIVYGSDDTVAHAEKEEADEAMQYGLPTKKKFPMPDADHVRSAIKFFNYVSPKDEEELASAILNKMDEYGVNDIEVGKNNRFSKYYKNKEEAAHMMTSEAVYEAVLHDDDDIAHYGRLGMKWYQHLYGEYQGAAKYAEKGAKRVDKYQAKGKTKKAKALRGRVDKVIAAAQKAKSNNDTNRKKIIDAINEHSSDKEVQKAAAELVKFDTTSRKSDDIMVELRKDKVSDLARGIGDWKTASDTEISDAITRLNLEKKYKDIRDEVTGAKVWKEAGIKALNSVADASGNVVQTLVKGANDRALTFAKNQADINKANNDARIAEEKAKLDAQIAKEKDERTWKREDTTKAWDVKIEEAKNRDKYLDAQTKKLRTEEDIRNERRERSTTAESDKAIADIMAGTRDISTLTKSQASNLNDYMAKLGLTSKDKSVSDVLAENKQNREAAKKAEEAAKKAAEDARKDEIVWRVKNDQAAEALRKQKSQEREAQSAESYKKMEQLDKRQQNKEQKAAAKAEEAARESAKRKEAAEREAIEKSYREGQERKARESNGRSDLFAYFGSSGGSEKTSSVPKSDVKKGSDLLRVLSDVTTSHAKDAAKVARAADAAQAKALKTKDNTYEDVAKQMGISAAKVYDLINNS